MKSFCRSRILCASWWDGHNVATLRAIMRSYFQHHSEFPLIIQESYINFHSTKSGIDLKLIFISDFVNYFWLIAVKSKPHLCTVDFFLMATQRSYMWASLFHFLLTLLFLFIFLICFAISAENDDNERKSAAYARYHAGPKIIWERNLHKNLFLYFISGISFTFSDVALSHVPITHICIV